MNDHVRSILETTSRSLVGAVKCTGKDKANNYTMMIKVQCSSLLLGPLLYRNRHASTEMGPDQEWLCPSQDSLNYKIMKVAHTDVSETALILAKLGPASSVMRADGSSAWLYHLVIYLRSAQVCSASSKLCVVFYYIFVVAELTAYRSCTAFSAAA